MTDKIHGFIKVHSSDLVVPTLTVRSRSAGGMMGRMRWIVLSYDSIFPQPSPPYPSPAQTRL